MKNLHIMKFSLLYTQTNTMKHIKQITMRKGEIRMSRSIRRIDLTKYLPNKNERQKLLKKVAIAFIEKFIENIDTQKTWNNKKISDVEPITQHIKTTHGWGNKSLVRKDHDFLKSRNWSITIRNNTLIIQMKSNLAKKYQTVSNVAIRLDKNYDEVMPDLQQQKEKQFFKDRIFEEVRTIISQKIAR